jgi:hypothetical protein
MTCHHSHSGLLYTPVLLRRWYSYFTFLKLDCFPCAYNALNGIGKCLNEGDYDPLAPSCLIKGTNQVHFYTTGTDVCLCDPGVAFVQASITVIEGGEDHPWYACQ